VHQTYTNVMTDKYPKRNDETWGSFILHSSNRSNLSYEANI